MELSYYKLFNKTSKQLNYMQSVYYYENLKKKIFEKMENNLINIQQIYTIYPNLDLNFYKLYSDLIHFSQNKLIDHYINIGIHENRLTSVKMFLQFYPNFNLNFYKTTYHDIANLSDEYLYIHYWTDGNKENRIYSLDNFIDIYPDFILKSYVNIIYNNIFLNKILLDIPKVIKNNQNNLIILACHTDKQLKYQILLNNINFLNKNTSYQIIIINSIGTENYNYNFSNVIQVYFIENNKYSDFGKWEYVCDNFQNILSYDNIIFTNDSFIITNSINNFYKRISDYDLFAYNDSSQIQYHYQSFLFSIKSSKIVDFSNFIKQYKLCINCYDDLVEQYEFRLNSLFIHSNCYLKLAYINGHQGHNIGFTNDKLYKLLIKNNFLPFIKIKKIYWENKIPEFIKNYLIRLNLIKYI
jgi:hypothetical protein